MNVDRLKEMMAAKKQAMRKVAKTVKLKAGDNHIRVLPGWRDAAAPDSEQWWHDFGQHFIKNAAGEMQAVYLCTDKTYGVPCEVCAALSKAGMSADEETKKVLSEARAGSNILVNALILGGSEKDTPQILEIRPSVFEQMLNFAETNGPAALLDPTEGFPLNIKREGSGLNTKYSVLPVMTRHPVSAAILSKLNNLDDYVKQESEENKRKAIAAVSNVSGHAAISLPSSRDVPATLPAPETSFRSATPAAEPFDASAATIDALMSDDAELDALMAGM